MKKTFVALAALLCLGCNCTTETAQTTTNTQTNIEPSGTAATAGEMCFRQVSGRQKQDTAWVHLTIINATVTGTYWHLPFEKDSRRGTLKGSKKDDVITASWTFMQEGQTDSLPVQFKLTGNQLQQKNYSFNPATGRAYLPDSAQFRLVYSKLDCVGSPHKIKNFQ